jgi:hypothetical protein
MDRAINSSLTRPTAKNYTPRVVAMPPPSEHDITRRMVPQDSRQPPSEGRSLDPATVEALRTCIAQRWRAFERAEQELVDTVSRAAQEARSRGLRPEELVIALKALEEDVMGQPGALRGTDPDARRRFREWLVSSCVKAYFAE